MRAVILIVLILLVAGGAYLFFFQRPLVETSLEEARQQVSGFTPAKTPKEAMDLFAKAVKERDYSAAARYCTSEYASILNKGTKAGYEVGWRIDKLKNLMEDKGLDTDRSLVVLVCLDPFPARFERSTKKIEDVEDNEGKKKGYFKTDPVKLTADPNTFQGMDIKMFFNGLMPSNAHLFSSHRPEFVNRVEPGGIYYGVYLISEGEGENKSWKMEFPLSEAEKTALEEKVEYFEKHHKKYVNALDFLLEDIHRGRYDSGKAFETELIDRFKKQAAK